MRTDPGGDGERVRTYVAGANDDDVTWRHAADARQQHAAAAVLLEQAPGAGEYGQPAGDRGHRRQDRQAARLADGLVRDEARARGEGGIEEIGIGAEMLEAEHGLARARLAVLAL